MWMPAVFPSRTQIRQQCRQAKRLHAIYKPQLNGFVWRSMEAMDTGAMGFSTRMIFKSWGTFAQLCCHWLWHAASIRHWRLSRSLYQKWTRFLFQSTPRLTNLKCNCFLLTSSIERLRKSRRLHLKSTRILFQSTPRLTNLKCNCFALTSTQ